MNGEAPQQQPGPLQGVWRSAGGGRRHCCRCRPCRPLHPVFALTGSAVCPLHSQGSTPKNRCRRRPTCLRPWEQWAPAVSQQAGLPPGSAHIAAAPCCCISSIPCHTAPQRCPLCRRPPCPSSLGCSGGRRVHCGGGRVGRVQDGFLCGCRDGALHQRRHQGGGPCQRGRPPRRCGRTPHYRVWRLGGHASHAAGAGTAARWADGGQCGTWRWQWRVACACCSKCPLESRHCLDLMPRPFSARRLGGAQLCGRWRWRLHSSVEERVAGALPGMARHV